MSILNKDSRSQRMSFQEWTLLRRHLPDYFTCAYVWIGLVAGAVSGSILTEILINICK
jgi:hypothetical protein